MDNDCFSSTVSIFILLFSLFIFLIKLLHSPKKSNCPNCKTKFDGTYHFCPECNFDIANYLVKNTKVGNIPLKYKTNKFRCHTITQIIILSVGIGFAFLPILMGIFDSNLLNKLSILVFIVPFIGLYFYFLGVKCPVCGHINLSGAEKHCTNCGVKLE